MVSINCEVMSDTGLPARYRRCDDVFAVTRMRQKGILGSGMSGYVALVRHSTKKSRKWAMKLFDRARDKRQNLDGVMKECFLREVAILQHLFHPHIMSNIVAYDSPAYRAIGMPYYSEGSLATMLETILDRLIPKFFVQLLSAVHHLHRRQLVHRDIKPDNILVKNENIVLTDFGVACNTSRSPPIHNVGTDGYLAPELLSNTRRSDPTLDLYKCDAYAVGATFYNMVFKNNDPPVGRCPHCFCKIYPLGILSRIGIDRLCDHNTDTRWSIIDFVKFSEHHYYLSQLLEIGSEIWK